jgi:hypothetical protein
VRVAAEHAHVHPFRESNAAFEYRFATQSSESPSGSAGVSVLPPPSNSGSPPRTFGPSPAELVRRGADTYQACYERQALARDHTVAGTVEVHMSLDAAGRITQLSLRSESNNPDRTLMELVARCIEPNIRRIEFGPQPDPGSEIVVPLAFNP